MNERGRAGSNDDDSGVVLMGYGGAAAVESWTTHLNKKLRVRMRCKIHTKSDGSQSILTGWPNRGQADILLDTAPELVFPAAIFKCKTVRTGLGIMHVRWGRFFERMEEKDPLVFARDGNQCATHGVTLLHMHGLAFSFNHPSPTVISNCFHLPCFTARHQHATHVPNARSSKLVEDSHWTRKQALRKGQNNFNIVDGDATAQVETLRQLQTRTEVEKYAYSDRVEDGLRRRIEYGVVDVRGSVRGDAGGGASEEGGESGDDGDENVGRDTHEGRDDDDDSGQDSAASDAE